MLPRAFLTLMLLAGLPGIAGAADGQMEIGPTCAAVGCSSGDAAGYPISITTAGSYILTGPLAPTGSLRAIQITAADVTVDLNGFAITGPGSGAAVGIWSNGQRVAIRNGIVRDMGSHGIEITQHGARVEDVSAHDNGGDGILVTIGAHVARCNVRSNGSEGIRTSTGSVVVQNVAVLNGADGIRTSGSVVGNVALNNGGDGLDVSSGLVRDNTVRLSTGFGLDGGTQVAYGGNLFVNNNGGGDQVDTGPIDAGGNVCSTDTICP